LNNPERARARAIRAESDVQVNTEASDEVKEPNLVTQEEIDKVYNRWEDTDATTDMWKLISSGTVDDLTAMLKSNPLAAYVRSSDGRGPMWWAFESRKQDMVKILMNAGLSHTDKDKFGKTPVDLLG